MEIRHWYTTHRRSRHAHLAPLVDDSIERPRWHPEAGRSPCQEHPGLDLRSGGLPTEIGRRLTRWIVLASKLVRVPKTLRLHPRIASLLLLHRRFLFISAQRRLPRSSTHTAGDPGTRKQANRYANQRCARTGSLPFAAQRGSTAGIYPGSIPHGGSTINTQKGEFYPFFRAVASRIKPRLRLQQIVCIAIQPVHLPRTLSEFGNGARRRVWVFAVRGRATVVECGEIV